MKLTILAVVAMAASVMAAPVVEVRPHLPNAGQPSHLQDTFIDAFGYIHRSELLHPRRLLPFAVPAGKSSKADIVFHHSNLIFPVYRYGWRGWKREAEAQETATVRGAGGSVTGSASVVFACSSDLSQVRMAGMEA